LSKVGQSRRKARERDSRFVRHRRQPVHRCSFLHFLVFLVQLSDDAMMEISSFPNHFFSDNLKIQVFTVCSRQELLWHPNYHHTYDSDGRGWNRKWTTWIVHNTMLKLQHMSLELGQLEWPLRRKGLHQPGNHVYFLPTSLPAVSEAIVAGKVKAVFLRTTSSRIH